MYGEGATMSRRKQLNPKPLLINDFQCSVDEIEKEIEKTEEDSPNYDPPDFGLDTKHEPNSNDKSPLPTNNADDNVSCSSLSNLISEHQKLPKLKLNVSLASDPALQPDAKDLRLENRDASPDKNIYDDTPNSDVIQRVKVFMCHPCGIGFSSLSTLEAHQAYYCSHRNDKDEGETSTLNIVEKISSGEAPTKSIKTGRQYACNQCSYSADKKVSLNRHMRMHQTSPGSASNVSTIDNNYSTQIDRYCSECDIRFSNAKTFNAHKQHYCHSRRIDNQGSAPTVVDVEKTKWKSPLLQTSTLPSVQPFLALPTNPILIIPYSLLRKATFLPGSIAAITGEVENSNSTCFAYENGTVRPLAVAATSSNNAHETLQIIIGSNTDFGGSSPSVLTERNSKVTTTQGPKIVLDDSYSKEVAPLDLSLRKLANDGIFEEKENVCSQIDVNTPTHIICAPSPLNSPSPMIPPSMEEASPFVMNLPTPPSVLSPPRNSVSDKANESKQAPESKQASESIATRTPILEVDPEANNLSSSTNLLCTSISAIANSSPQIYVKQGVSKCKECNIVFCKYENYLAHKQHYCSSRLKEDSRRNTSNTSPSNSIPQSVAYQQLICAACGIKYTSLDNLRAHQSFYCPKGNELTASLTICKEKCLKCNVVHDTGHCSISQDAFKCPVCDTVSSSAIESKRHFETHGTIKAFRCSICRYKGNTLRGMRSHIRLHFDKKGMDLNEENYMMCIMEDEPLVVDALCSETGNADAPLQIFKCDVCSYSSSYKGNVVRHMKLIHSLPSANATVSSGKENDASNNNEAEDLSTYLSGISNIDCTDTKAKKLNEISSIKTEETDEGTSHNEHPPSIESTLTNDNSRRYCQACDIKFKYLNSYLVHKQFYCNRNDSETNDFFLDSNQLHSTCDRSKPNLETVL